MYREGSAVRILVADDHEVMRIGIRKLWEAVPNWSVCAEACNSKETVDLSVQSPPDVLIMDITMLENGFEAAEKIAELLPDVPSSCFRFTLPTHGREARRRRDLWGCGSYLCFSRKNSTR